MADATQVQRRRGTESQCDGMTPAEAEVIVDLTNDTLRVGDGVRAGGFIMPNFNHIQRQSFGYAVSAGTGNAITVALSPALLAYADGVALEFKASNNNTGATTLDVNGLGAKSIKKLSGGVLTDVASGDIVSGVVYRVTYDGVQFQVTNAEFTTPAPTGGLQKISVTNFAGLSGNIDIPIPSTGYTSYILDFNNMFVNTPSGVSFSVSAGGISGAGTIGGTVSGYKISGQVNIVNYSGAGYIISIKFHSASGYVSQEGGFGTSSFSNVRFNGAGSFLSGIATLYGRQ